MALLPCLVFRQAPCALLSGLSSRPKRARDYQTFGVFIVPRRKKVYSFPRQRSTMDETINSTGIQQGLLTAGSQLLNQIAIFTPKIISALLILVLGTLAARWIKSLVIKGLEALRISKGTKDTPLDAFLHHAEVGRIEVVIGSIFYWLIILFVLQSAVSVLGLSSLSAILDRLLSYLPNILSAGMVLVFGILLAGLAESFVKGAIRSLNGSHPHVFGKVVSYLIMTITLMAAIVELKIAQQFISILFTGMVATASLAAGLALGLGGKDVVGKMFQEWYDRSKKRG